MAKKNKKKRKVKKEENITEEKTINTENKSVETEQTEDLTKDTVNQEEKEEQKENVTSEKEEVEKDSEEKEQEKQEKEPEKSELELLQEKYNELNDRYLRVSAEFDNYRKRTLKEKMELTKTAGEDILVNILPVIDNFERALSTMTEAKDVVSVKEGVEMIYKHFAEFLKQRGVKEIEAKEKEFDTDIHEAVTKIPAPNKELKGKVVDVIEKGYFLHDKVIRYSKVVIGE